MDPSLWIGVDQLILIRVGHVSDPTPDRLEPVEEHQVDVVAARAVREPELKQTENRKVKIRFKLIQKLIQILIQILIQTTTTTTKQKKLKSDLCLNDL